MNNDIDFDLASSAWRQNKIYIGRGWFLYKCNYIHSNGNQCNKPIYNYTVNNISYKYNDIEKDARNMNHINKNKYCKKHLNRGKI